jgi:hypothetical protein
VNPGQGPRRAGFTRSIRHRDPSSSPSACRPADMATKSWSPSPPFGRTNYDADDIWRLGISP